MLEIVEGEAVESTSESRLVYRAGLWSSWADSAGESRDLFPDAVAESAEV